MGYNKQSNTNKQQKKLNEYGKGTCLGHGEWEGDKGGQTVVKTK